MVKIYNNINKSIKTNETKINVIRKNTIVGSGVSTYIECNNKIYSLSSGNSMSCITKNEINNINIITNIGGIFPTYDLSSILPVDNRLNEEIFYYIEPWAPIKELNSDYGKTLIIDFDANVKGSEKNLFHYDTEIFTLLNPGIFLNLSSSFNNNYVQSKDKYYEKFMKLVENQYKKEKSNTNSNGMKNSDESSRMFIAQELVEKMDKVKLNNYRYDKTLMKVDDINKGLNKEESRIILFRKMDNGSPLLGVWDKDKFVGDLGVESYIDYKTKDNKLILYSYYHDLRTLEIPLEKGETYYVNVDFDIGWEENTIEFLQVSKDYFEKLEDSFCKITFDESKITPLMKKRLEKGSKIIKEKFIINN